MQDGSEAHAPDFEGFSEQVRACNYAGSDAINLFMLRANLTKTTQDKVNKRSPCVQNGLEPWVDSWRKWTVDCLMRQMQAVISSPQTDHPGCCISPKVVRIICGNLMIYGVVVRNQGRRWEFFDHLQRCIGVGHVQLLLCAEDWKCAAKQSIVPALHVTLRIAITIFPAQLHSQSLPGGQHWISFVDMLRAGAPVANQDPPPPNGCLVNRYRDGKDYIVQYRDDEPQASCWSNRSSPHLGGQHAVLF